MVRAVTLQLLYRNAIYDGATYDASLDRWDGWQAQFISEVSARGDKVSRHA
jgi:hypothetical protein